MSDITLRLVKGTPLTNQEVDDNFANLNDDKVEIGGDLSGNTEAPIVSAIQGVAVSATAPSTNQVLTFTGSQLEYSDVQPTDLGTSANTTTRTVTSSTGNNVVLPSANATQAGVMSSSDRTKLDGIETGAQVNVGTDLGIIAGTTTGPIVTSSTGNNATLPKATASNSGVVTTSNQTFAGIKTFNNNSIFNADVGIGTTSPQASMHINKQGSPNVDFILENASTTGNARFFLKTGSTFNRDWEFFAAGNDGAFGIYDGVGTARRFTILPNGNVGIGDSNPSEKLDVDGTVKATVFDGPLSGNANTATTLATGRTIGMTGDVTWTSGSFDGSSNVTGTSTLANSGVTAGSYGSATQIPVITVDAKGRITNASTSSITVGDGTLTLATSGIASGSQTFTANQGTNATFTVDVPGTDLSIGSSTGTVVRIDSSTGTNATIPVANTTVAGVVTTGDQSFAGTKTFTNTISGSIDGNANTVTTLQTARTINGTSFNGSTDITTANWGTARTLTIGSTGKSVNGSENVSWSLSEIGVNNNTLTLATSGIASGSQTWTANQGTNATFTVDVPGTNLGTSANTTTRTVTSSTGDNVVLPSANTTQAGVMTSDDRTKLDGIEAGAEVNVPTDLGQSRNATSYTITSSTGDNTTLAAATTTNAGVFVATDKTKLDGIEDGAQVNTVTSVASKTGAVTLTNADVGLGNVTNHAQVRKITSSTNGNVPVWNGTDGNILSNGYGVETTLTGGSGNLARADAIKTYVDGILASNDAMVFKGTLGTGGTFTSLPTTHDVGWTIKVITPGTYAGQVAEVGDMYVSLVSRSGSENSNSDWAVIQTNIDGAVTGPTSSVNNHVALFDGTSGKTIKSSGSLLGDGTLTLATSGIASGSQTFGANQTTNATFTVDVPGTNLGTSANTTTRTVTSSTGTNVVLSSANTTQAGVMTSADKIKLDGLTSGTTDLGVSTDENTVTITSSTGNDATILSANTTSAGILSSDDKKRIDRIEAKSIAFAIALG